MDSLTGVEPALVRLEGERLYRSRLGNGCLFRSATDCLKWRRIGESNPVNVFTLSHFSKVLGTIARYSPKMEAVPGIKPG